MKRWRSDGGQATGEYVALIALVATALALAAGLTSGGVGARVLAGLQRGLCAVAGRDCPRPTPIEADLPPCPLERSTRNELLSGTLGLVELGAGGTLSAVRGSDGRVTVTLAHDRSAGGAAGVGLHAAAGGGSLGGEGRATLAATWTSGRSWTFPDAAAAHAFVARYGSKATVGGQVVDELRSGCSLLCDAIGWRPHPQLPPPDATYEEGGTLAALTGGLGLGGPALASGEGRSARLLGRRSGRDGTTTWYVRMPRDAAFGLGVEPARLGVELADTTVASYTVDPAGRPVTFVLHVAHEIGARASLSVAGSVHGRAAADAARLEEIDATLDLHDPANAAAALEALVALSGRERLPALLAQVAALGRRLARQGELDRRVYALQRTAAGVGATVGLGVELGAGLDRTTDGARLLDAETRLPGLPFLPRDDCRRG